MNLRVIKKKFQQEVIFDVDGNRNPRLKIVRRFCALCVKVFGGFLLTLVLAPISLIRPIEIWHLRNRRPKISLLIEDLEWGLRNLQNRNSSKKPIIFAIYFLPFPNKQIVKMYRRVLFLIGPSQIFFGMSLKFVLPIFQITKKNPLERYEQMFETWKAGKPSIYFSRHEVKLGKELERRIFGNETPPFVCLAVQSFRYKYLVDVPKTKYAGELVDNPFSSIAGLESYLPVIRYLTNRGIGVVRMGILEDEPLPVGLGPMVVDYAFKFRSELGDLWLSSKCQFVLSAGSGVHWFATALNKPVVISDSYAITGSYGANSLLIPQRGWHSTEERFISFSEIANREFGREEKLLNAGMKIIKNSEQEIIDVVAEMVDRISGTWIETDDDLNLQNRYRKLVDSFPAHQRTPAKMGAKFLREHQHLLPD